MKQSPVGAKQRNDGMALFDLDSSARAVRLFQKTAQVTVSGETKGPCICDLLLRGSKYVGLCYIGYLLSVT